MQLKLLVAIAALMSASAAASAATTTSTFTVQTNVTPACSVSASTLTFADVNPLLNASTATDATTTISVTCSNTTAYNVGLDAGTGPTATVTSRKMKIGATTDTLNYSLFRDSARTTNWGNTVGTDTVAGTGMGLAQSLTVFGRIPSGQQTAKVGAYADTITVTVTY